MTALFNTTLIGPRTCATNQFCFEGTNSIIFYFYRYVQEGALRLRPTLTADRFGEEFLYNGTLDLWKEGCNANWGGGCVV